jgi:UDP-glucose 4-epimerase
MQFQKEQSNINFMKNKILVTGGAGYIGSHTVSALIKSGFEVVIVDDLSTGFKRLIHPKARMYQVSILNTEAIKDILRNEQISGVIHFAAKIIVPESIAQPIEYYKNNTMGVLSVLEACKVAEVKNIVFSSTAAVYGNASMELITELDSVSPINPYGSSKLFSEQIIKDCEFEFGLQSVILRYFNVAGASESLQLGQLSKNASHLIKIASEVACGKRDSMSITGTDYPTSDGTGVRDYIHVEDLADIHVLGIKFLLDGGKSEIFNCGYGHGTSVREVIEAIRKVSGVNLKALEAPRRPGDAAQLVADSRKIRQTLGWIPKRDSLETICRTAYLFEKSLES